MDYGRFIFFSFKTDHPIGGMCDVLCHFNNHNEAKEQLNNRKNLSTFLSMTTLNCLTVKEEKSSCMFKATCQCN